MKTTNWVAIVAPLLTWVFGALGVPLPAGELAPVIVSAVQSAATLVARNRAEIAGVTGWGWLAYGKK